MFIGNEAVVSGKWFAPKRWQIQTSEVMLVGTAAQVSK